MHKKNTLFIMVKYPQAGRVKTRLGQSLGHGRAVNIYRSLMTRLFARMCHDPRWETILAISPHHTLMADCWPHDILRTPQINGDLGDRMGHILTRTAAGSVVIIGADCPAVHPNDIAAAFNSLRKNDAVFGPSKDGGYWLVGQKGLQRPFIFDRVRWSTSDTLEDTLSNCRGLKVGSLRTLRDIDEADDYKAWLRS